MVRRAIREAVHAGRFGDLFSAGEPKAHLEIAHKHKVDFRCVAGSCGKVPHKATRCDIHRPFGAVFVVAGLGVDATLIDRTNAGIENNVPDELNAWRAQSRGCGFVMSEKFTVDK